MLPSRGLISHHGHSTAKASYDLANEVAYRPGHLTSFLCQSPCSHESGREFRPSSWSKHSKTGREERDTENASLIFTRVHSSEEEYLLDMQETVGSIPTGRTLGSPSRYGGPHQGDLG